MAEEDEVPWSRIHSLFANMGGFVIRWNVCERVGNVQEAESGSSTADQARIITGISDNHKPGSTLHARSADIQLNSPPNEPGDRDNFA